MMRSVWPKLVYGFAAAAVVMAPVLITYAIYMEKRKFHSVYIGLGVLPLNSFVEDMPEIRRELSALSENICDDNHVRSLANALIKVDRSSIADNFLNGYAQRCAYTLAYSGGYSHITILETLREKANNLDITQSASLLLSHFCNRLIMLDLIHKLQSIKDVQSIAHLGRSYIAKCGYDNDVAYQAALAHYDLGDVNSALQVARQGDAHVPNTVYWPYWIGKALMRLGRYSEAADQFKRSLRHWSDPSKVAASEFWNVSNALKLAGRYCDAVAPLRQYVSYNQAERLTPQVQGELRELVKRGNCL